MTITDGGGRTASAEFAVAEAVIAGEAEPMAAAFLRLSAALDDIDELLRQAREALADGDVPRQTSLLRQMVCAGGRSTSWTSSCRYRSRPNGASRRWYRRWPASGSIRRR